MSANHLVTRYHPVLAVLHWLIAIVILAPLVFGARHLAPMSNLDPAKIAGLQVHITVGALVGVLMLARLVVRSVTRRPPAATTGARWLDRIAWASHRLLYLAVMAQAATGVWLAVQAGVFAPVFEGHGALPADFWVFAARRAHYVVSRLLMVLIGLHVLGAAYHIVIRRDGLLKRMAFGGRVA